MRKLKLGDWTARNAVKYLRYGLDAKSFSPNGNPYSPTAQAIEAARSIRGIDRAPALLIHGIMPRSGTVYAGELLRLHPDLHAFPDDVWEFPFLQQTAQIVKLQRKFLLAYEQNMDKIGGSDFLPLFGASLIAYLYAATPPGKRLLVKVPSVQYLTQFHAVFPHEHLLLMVRDGRDLVQSTLNTWPVLRFSMVCMRWRRAANMVLAFDNRHRENQQGYALARFEDMVHDPESFVRGVCRRFNLAEDRYPWDRVGAVPVRGSSTLVQAGAVSWNPVAKSDHFQPTGHWQHWSGYHRWLFKRLAGRPLLDLGYCSDLTW